MPHDSMMRRLETGLIFMPKFDSGHYEDLRVQKLYKE